MAVRLAGRLGFGVVLAVISILVAFAVMDYQLAAQTVAPTDEVQTGEDQPVEAEPNETDPEVIALRAQLEQMRRTDDQFLQTVYWSLGTILAVSILLVTYGWFSSMRTYDRDKDAMRQELHASLREDVVSFQAATRAEVASQLSNIEAEIRESTQLIVKNNSGRLEMNIKQLERNLQYARHQLSKMEAASWESRGVLNNALRDNLAALSIGMNVGAGHIVAEAISEISRLLAKGARPDAHLASEITSALDGVPPNYSADVAAAKTLLLNAREKKPSPPS